MTVTLMKGAAQICLVEKGGSRLCVRAPMLNSWTWHVRAATAARLAQTPEREVAGTAPGCAGRPRQSQAWTLGPPPCATLLPAIGQRSELKIVPKLRHVLKAEELCLPRLPYSYKLLLFPLTGSF